MPGSRKLLPGRWTTITHRESPFLPFPRPASLPSAMFSKRGGYPWQGPAPIGALRAVYAKRVQKLRPAVLFRSGWKTGPLKCPRTHDLDLALDRSTPQKAIYAVTGPAKSRAAAASARAKGPVRQRKKPCPPHPSSYTL